MIRTARDEDAAAIHAIYAPSVIDGVATFETELPGVKRRAARGDAAAGHHPDRRLFGTLSVAMHEAMGFTPAGVWRQCGYKLGRWWDVGVWQKELQPAQILPRAVTPFNALVEAPALRELLD